MRHEWRDSLHQRTRAKKHMTILLQGAGLQVVASVTPSGPTPLLDLEADTLVLSDGDPVSLWADQSGNGYDFTQSDSSARPSYLSNYTGYPSSRLDPTVTPRWM